MLIPVDWQEIISLAVVTVTAVIFVTVRLWRHQKHHEFALCNCSSKVRRQGSIIYRARKGERPQIIIQTK